MLPRTLRLAAFKSQQFIVRNKKIIKKHKIVKLSNVIVKNVIHHKANVRLTKDGIELSSNYKKILQNITFYTDYVSCFLPMNAEIRKQI